jgi:hypothetical protein
LIGGSGRVPALHLYANTNYKSTTLAHPEMGVAPGGKIRQVIKPDIYPNAWLPAKITVFNVQIFNASSFKTITGRDLPPSSIDAATYAKHGQPLFKFYERKRAVMLGISRA